MTPIRFLHTADWQLGMRRHFLDQEALPRFMQARIDAISTMAGLAKSEGCAFVVACGDVFDSNHVDRRTLRRSLEALATVPCPVYLLPGNHDPLDAGSIYKSDEFASHKPPNVRLLDTNQPVEAAPGVALLGVPWLTKTPRRDLVAEACAKLEVANDTRRICAAHGMVDSLSPDRDDPALISKVAMESAVNGNLVHYFALGDRHSATEVGPRIWYSGAPEATDYREDEAGKALVVELTEDECHVVKHPVGRWRFETETFEFSSGDDVDAAARRLEAMTDKGHTILKLTLKGALNLKAKARLDNVLEEAGDLFGALEVWARHTDLMVLPDNLDFESLGLAGFARSAALELKEMATGEGDEARVARDALALLYRTMMGQKA
jgi:DNA repair exonuclease SbcCD nuclease subunit